MTINNPCRWFIDGSSTVEFAHEGGDTLYHFSGVDSGIQSYHGINLIFFANNEEHAKDVLRRMFNARKDAASKFSEAYPGDTRPVLQDDVCELFLSSEDKWKIELAPTNQMFQTSWAGNDTIL